MSDTLDQEIQEENPNLRQLREKAGKADEAIQEAETARQEAAMAKRELALALSGVDFDSPQGKLLAKAYDGEMTAEAIQEAAKEYGVPIKGQEPSEPVLPDTGTEIRRTLSGEEPPNVGEVVRDPYEVALENANKSLQAGATEDTAMGDFIATLSAAAHNGDQRVIWEPQPRPR